MPFSPTNVKIGPGTLYAAPLGTTEPTAVTGVWPPNWVALGFTDQGSTFTFQPTLAAVMVEETFWPLKNVITHYAAKLTFTLAETTKQNLILALNGGIGSSVNATMTGTTPTALWVEPPTPGKETRIMLGWDSLPQAASAGNATTAYSRLVCRQCIQSGALKTIHRKGANKVSYAATFELEKPVGKQPFRVWLTKNLIN